MGVYYAVVVLWGGGGLAVAATCFGNKLSLPTKIYDHDQVNQFTFTCWRLLRTPRCLGLGLAIKKAEWCLDNLFWVVLDFERKYPLWGALSP